MSSSTLFALSWLTLRLMSYIGYFVLVFHILSLLINVFSFTDRLQELLQIPFLLDTSRDQIIVVNSFDYSILSSSVRSPNSQSFAFSRSRAARLPRSLLRSSVC